MDFYQKIALIKLSKNLKNNDLGGIIGMKGETFRMAIKRKSLSQLQIKEIEKFFDENQFLSDNNLKTDKFESIDYLLDKIKILNERIEDKNVQIEALIEHNKLLRNQIESTFKELKVENIEIKNLINTHFQYTKLLFEFKESENSIKNKSIIKK
ncbi:MAG: hypothetical protein QM535_11490 [Limnohabitans sp.]|nr:hypothetical protein [Limnohabitans sp.]